MFIQTSGGMAVTTRSSLLVTYKAREEIKYEGLIKVEGNFKK